jgi:hypothetical protein
LSTYDHRPPVILARIIFYGILDPSCGRLSYAVHHSTIAMTLRIGTRSCREPTDPDMRGPRFPTTTLE